MQASLTDALLRDLSLGSLPFILASSQSAQSSTANSRLGLQSSSAGASRGGAASSIVQDSIRRRQGLRSSPPKQTGRVGRNEKLATGDDSLGGRQGADDVSGTTAYSRPHADGSGQPSTESASRDSGPRGRVLLNDVSGRARGDISREPEDDVSSDSGAGRVWELSQEPRLWMSPAGAVSPLHFDASPSCLLQVRGTCAQARSANSFYFYSQHAKIAVLRLQSGASPFCLLQGRGFARF
jgi:hypothetical protein